MYEDMTYEYLLQEKLSQISNDVDKREGSIIYDAMAGNSMESAMIYEAIDSVYKETNPETASRENLIDKVRERGLTPLPATAAVGIGEFNIDVPIGARFSLDNYNWVVTDQISTGKFHLTCETAGEAPNALTGNLIPIDYIDGLESAVLTSIVINGEDEEETEALRARYYESFDSQSYSFNRAQYISVTEAFPGVGGCKVYRAAFGPGTVKLVITDSDYGVPSFELIESVQTAIDPTQNSGEGIGLAPIDHKVTVVGATGVAINIETTMSFAAGWSLETAMPNIEEALDAYYEELNSTWADEEALIVRISQIESRLLTLPGVVDIMGTKLNGSPTNAVLDEAAIAVRGTFDA